MTYNKWYSFVYSSSSFRININVMARYNRWRVQYLSKTSWEFIEGSLNSWLVSISISINARKKDFLWNSLKWWPPLHYFQAIWLLTTPTTLWLFSASALLGWLSLPIPSFIFPLIFLSLSHHDAHTTVDVGKGFLLPSFFSLYLLPFF